MSAPARHTPDEPPPACPVPAHPGFPEAELAPLLAPVGAWAGAMLPGGRLDDMEARDLMSATRMALRAIFERRRLAWIAARQREDEARLDEAAEDEEATREQGGRRPAPARKPR